MSNRFDEIVMSAEFKRVSVKNKFVRKRQKTPEPESGDLAHISNL